MRRGCFRYTNLRLIFVDWAKEKWDYLKMFGTRHLRSAAETGSDALRSPMCVITLNSQERKGNLLRPFYSEILPFFLPGTNQLKTETAARILSLIWILLFRRFTITILCPYVLWAGANCFVFVIFPLCFSHLSICSESKADRSLLK